MNQLVCSDSISSAKKCSTIEVESLYLDNPYCPKPFSVNRGSSHGFGVDRTVFRRMVCLSVLKCVAYTQSRFSRSA